MVVAEARWIARSNDVILAIFSATTGSEILRVKSIWPGRYGADAGWRAIHLDDIWLVDSSGIVVITPSGPRIVTLDGEWEWAPGRASAVDADLFYSVFDSLPAVVDRIGKVLASVSFGSAAPPLGTYFRSEPRGVCYLGTRAHWGLSADTVSVRRAGGCAPEGPAILVGGLGIPLAPVIEQGPFNQHLRIEVVVDTCVNLRNEPAIDASIVTCLPHGTVVSMEASPRRGAIAPEWMHIRTVDGVEGWAHADYLRWHSDGVRLEE